jgi:hypothetical protein
MSPTKKEFDLFFTLFKVLLWLLGIVIVLIIIFFITIAILGYVYRDSVQVDDSSLLLPIVTLQDNQNAYFDLQDAVSAWQQLNSSTSSLSVKKTASEAIVKALDIASRKVGYQDPAMADQSKTTANSVLPSLNSYRKIIELNNVLAVQLATSSMPAKGLAQSMVGLEVGSQIVQSQGTLIQWFVGVSMKALSLETLQTIATSTPQKSKDLITVAQALTPYTDDGSGLNKAYKIRYYADFKSVIKDLVSGNGAVLKESSTNSTFSNTTNHISFYWHPNESIGYAVADTQQQILVGMESCSKFNSNANQPRRQSPKSNLLTPFTPNLIGKVLYDILSVSLSASKQKECSENMLLGATQLVFVIKAYELEHNSLPSSLEVLEPKYLSVIPEDPYSGKSYKYNVAKRIIYSVGPGHKDSGGTNGDWSHADNPTFSF